MTLYVPHPCDDPERCHSSPAAAADCYVHCWDPELSPLSGEPASAMTAFEQARVAQDPRSPAHLLREIYTLNVEAFSPGLAYNPSTPEEILDRIRTVGTDEAKLNLLINPATDPDEVRQALHAGSGPRSRAAALNESLTIEDFHFAIYRCSDAVRREALTNPSCPPEILFEFATDPDDDTRFAVASNPSTPDMAMMHLADDESPAVRYATATRIKDIDILTSLARERVPDIRHGALMNPLLPTSMLWEILHADGQAIGQTPIFVAEHRNASEDIVVETMRVVDRWDFDDIEEGDEDQYEEAAEVSDAVESRAVVWMRRERGIDWDDVEMIDAMIDGELLL